MFNANIQNLHRWLKSQGYKHVGEETTRYTYDGFLNCNQVKVPIRLSFLDLSFQEFPDIHLLDPRPETLRRPLPHVDHEGKLCYLEEESYRVDPYQPEQTVANILERARRVLTESIAGTNSKDVGYEFRAYWDFSDYGVILSKYSSGSFSKYNHLKYKTSSGQTRTQLVIGGDDEIKNYTKWREGELKLPRNHNALWVNINTSVLLPDNGTWPPNNFHDFHEWLINVDASAAKTLRNGLGTKEGAQPSSLIVLNTAGGFVSIEIVLPKGLRKSTNDPNRYRKQLLKDKGLLGTKFIRGILDDSSPSFLTTRNLSTSGLAGKRIVLIGCGTIGGYLSRLLIQSGAGQGNGVLILYDKQFFSTGNIGRHYLDGKYLYENKAEACRHKLLSEFPASRIQAIKKQFETINSAYQSDIIIDATGREPFSLSLNSQATNLHQRNQACPPILYIWIDGNGYCGRTLYYDGKSGCYRCLQDLSGKDRFEPLKSPTNLIPMKSQCGESFIPFPPSVSVQVSGMGLEAILDWANHHPEPHFRNRRYNKLARNHKDQHLTPQKGCPACQI